MASIRQTIPSYAGGISQQPDQSKKPGQVKDCLNAIPDVVLGLHKRPGSKRVGTAKLENIVDTAARFHYHRDGEEGSYIGQVDANGVTKVWKASGDNVGVEQTVVYGPRPWEASKSYNLYDEVQNDTGKVYRCDTAGTSAGSGGPTGTGANITDGTARWDYISTLAARETLIKEYSTDTDPQSNLQFLTINDTTFLTNRNKTVSTHADLTAAAPHTNYAYVELLRTENGRQYGLNIRGDSNNTTNYTTATRLLITDDTLAEGDGTGHCPGIGTQVFVIDQADDSYPAEIDWVKDSSDNVISDSSRRDLIFRLTTLGQQGNSNQNDEVSDANGFRCSYNRRIELLHGGQGWQKDDKVRVKLTQAQTNYYYTIRIEEIETTPIHATINSSDTAGLIRPAPTPFDADTAVTPDSILGGLHDALNATGLNREIVGSGVYIHDNSDSFQVEVVDKDLMRVMHSTINDVTELPIQCKHGYIVKVENARMSDEDDYYLRFEGENNEDGPGSWVECPAPGLAERFDNHTMPHVIERVSIANKGTPTELATFRVRRFRYGIREVGDNLTNPIPRFVGNTINQVLFFRNRLIFLSKQYVVCSRPGTADKPNFWANTALTTGATDPIDIASSSTLPSDLFNGLETNTGLLLFSSNHQFLFSSDDTVMNPDTAKVKSIAQYNYNTNLAPISLGTSAAFVDNSGKYSRFNEMFQVRREGEPSIFETSKIAPTLLDKDLDLICNSKENAIVLFGKKNSDTVVGYKYLTEGQKRIQSAWFKWKFNNPLYYHFIINDTYFYLDSDHFLHSLSLTQDDGDISIDQDSVNYLLHLDNYTTVTGGTFNVDTNITTFADQSDWIDDVTTPNGKLVIVDSNSGTKREGRYAECTVTNTDDFTVPGNWDYSEEFEVVHTNINTGNEQIVLTTGSTDHGIETGDLVRYVKGDTLAAGLTDGTAYYAIDASINNIALATSASNATAGVAVNITGQGTGTHKIQKLITNLNIGYLYDYQVEFPTVYVTKQAGETVRSDINSSLTLHRVKLSFGKIGLYDTTLTRVGKDPYNEIYESTEMDEYEASDAPYLEEEVRTVPVYERNKNVKITLKSTHPAPATLRAMTWEGDYSPKYYRSV